MVVVWGMINSGCMGHDQWWLYGACTSMVSSCAVHALCDGRRVHPQKRCACALDLDFDLDLDLDLDLVYGVFRADSPCLLEPVHRK